MLRKIMIFLVVLLVFAFGGLFIFINTFDLNKFLPQLTGQLSQTLGRQVTIERAGLQLSLKYGIIADIQGISLAEDEKFSKGSFVSIGHIHCGVNVMALLTKRQVEVTDIVVQSPLVTVIRNEKGEFNYESLIKATKPASGSGASSSGDNVQKSSDTALPKLLVNSFEIRNGKVVFSDRALKPIMNVALETIDVKVTNFSLTEPFKVQLGASFFAPVNNIHIEGTGRIDMSLQQIRCDDVRLSLDLGVLDMARMNKDIAALSASGLQPGLKGLIEVVISQVVLGPKGLLVLSLNGDFRDGYIPTKMLVKPVDGISVKFDVNESRVKLSEFAFNLGTGRVSGTANIKEYLTSQIFDIETNLEGILVEDTIDQTRSPARLKGSLAGTLKLAGEGFSPEALDKISGQAQFALTNGELTNVNILKSILERVPVLSALSAVAGTQLSEEWQTKVGGELTKIDKATVKARVEKSTVLLDEALLVSQKFSLAANGQAGFDQTVDMDAELIMSKELSESVIDSASDMKALVDEQGEIRFPVKITGKVPDLSYMPDVAYISKLLIVNKGGDALQKVLDKNPEAKKFLDILTGGSDEGQNSAEGTTQDIQEPSQDGGADTGSDAESAGKQLLKGLLQNF